MSSTTDAGPRRPGRPAQFDRDSALAALLWLLWSKGYDAATQEEMLAATGLSSSTLYRSFGTKADILEAALAQYLAYLDEMFAPLEHGRRGVADVHAFFDHLQAQFEGPMRNAGCLAWNTMQNPINGDPRIKTLTERHMERLRRGLTAALQRAADAEELPPSAPEYLADALRAGVLGVQARGRAGDAADAITLLDGLRGLLGRNEH
jgi:TetR/AcrR family transcriptional repressor of nem operon